jgi:hypothetical protein
VAVRKVSMLKMLVKYVRKRKRKKKLTMSRALLFLVVRPSGCVRNIDPLEFVINREELERRDMVCSFRSGVSTEGLEKREFDTAAVKENSFIEICQ